MYTVIISFLLFASLHSITVSLRFKNFCQAILGKTFMRVWYRFIYNTISTVTGTAAFYVIRTVPDAIVWTAPLWPRLIMQGIQIAGIVFGASAFRYLNFMEFLGWSQVWKYITRREVAGNSEGLTDKGLVTSGVYGIVRHPMYVAGMVIVTFSPVITDNGIALTIMTDLYFLFGMLIEERRFLKIFGNQYPDYMKNVPRMIPKWNRKRD